MASWLGLLIGAAVTMLGQRAGSQSAFAGPGLAPWAGAPAALSSRASPGSTPGGAPGSLGSPAAAPRASAPPASGLALAASALAFAGALWARSARPALRRRPRVGHLPKAAAGSAAADDLRLENIKEENVINKDGLIQPVMSSETQAVAFLIYDSAYKPQYLGFSKDFRNTLRTLLCRRPELCFYYRLAAFAEADQAAMLELRSAWVEELGKLPPGNSDARQKSLWESPVDGGAMNERAYKLVAEAKMKAIETALKNRGLKEPLEFNTDLIAQGKVDVLPL